MGMSQTLGKERISGSPVRDSSVRYEVRNGASVVTYKAENPEGWTPIMKRRFVSKPQEKGDGTRHNPVFSNNEVLRLDFAKDIRYTLRNGTPVVTFRKGMTNNSYQWSPIVPSSPIAKRTRTKFKT